MQELATFCENSKGLAKERTYPLAPSAGSPLDSLTVKVTYQTLINTDAPKTGDAATAPEQQEEEFKKLQEIPEIKKMALSCSASSFKLTASCLYSAAAAAPGPAAPAAEAVVRDVRPAHEVYVQRFQDIGLDSLEDSIAAFKKGSLPPQEGNQTGDAWVAALGGTPNEFAGLRERQDRLTDADTADCGEIVSVSVENQKDIQRIEREMYVTQRIQQRLQKDLMKYEDDLRKAQMEVNRAQEGSLTRFIQKTESALSQTNEKLSTLHNQLVNLKKVDISTAQAKLSNLDETRWRLVGKQMHDIFRGQKMQRLVSVQFRRLHGAILHTIHKFDLRTIRFKLQSGRFKGQFFSTIFRCMPFYSFASQAYFLQGKDSFFKHQSLALC